MAGKIILSEAAEPKEGTADELATIKAALCAKAAAAIETAGRGLFSAIKACETNAADGKTLAVLVVVQGYINDALMALIQRENSGLLDPDQLG